MKLAMDPNHTVYCIHCDQKSTYYLKPQRVNMDIRGIFFSYVEQIAYCHECDEEVYVPEIHGLNVIAREDAYRKVTHPMIKEESI